MFTTLECSEQEIVALYGERWAIETDLRTLKTTLRLEQLTCTTPDMVAKEIEDGPSGLQFGARHRVRLIIQTFGPLLAAAASKQEAQRLETQILKNYAAIG